MAVRLGSSVRILAGLWAVFFAGAWTAEPGAPAPVVPRAMSADFLTDLVDHGTSNPPQDGSSANKPAGRGAGQTNSSTGKPDGDPSVPLPGFVTDLFGKKSAATPNATAPAVTRGPAAVVRDVNCDTMVDPFELSDNMDRAIDDVASSAFRSLLTGQTDFKAIVLRAARDAARNMNWMPVATEEMWGGQMHDQRAASLISPEGNKKDKKYYANLNAAFARVRAGLPENLPFQFKLFVLNEDHVNAIADPGGFIYVSRPALDAGKGGKKEQAANEEKLTFMLAHELSHVLQRHETRALQSKLIDSVDTVFKLKQMIGQKQANPLSTIMVADMVANRFAKYTIDQEMQADTCAVRLLATIKGEGARAPFSAYSAWLSEQSEGYVTAHPSSPERIKHGEEMIARFDLPNAVAAASQVAPAPGQGVVDKPKP